MELIIVLLLIIILALASLSGFLFFYYFKINKQIDLLLDQGKVRDLREVIFDHVKKIKEIDAKLEEDKERIKLLEDISKITFQKISLTRFNPFKDLGGDQSFVIALLDGKDNGFVLSSFFGKNGGRIYAKPVVKGKSSHLLSDEEKDAITRAIGAESSKSETLNPK